MGRGGKSGKFNKPRGPNGPDMRQQQGWDSKGTGWNEEDRSNEAFEAYYKAQGILEESEWVDFLTALRRELPTTFRITGSRAHANAINSIITDTYVPSLLNLEIDSQPIPPPFQIPWYPEQLAWQLDAPKRVVRKSVELKGFQRFLVGETEIGNISRQEAVSMIPPLLLDVKPEHFCLDMCAAPGSKTAQIIEALNPHESDSPSGPQGLLIANDSDAKRCHMLVHQTGRMPSVGLGVTNWDASAFPNINIDAKGTSLKFDRILADVPCTGDGTLRKNCDIWKSWNALQGVALHNLQFRILTRAMTLLQPGGRLVYSTCSFNPIENEAVVAAALNAFPDFAIVPQDPSVVLPNLKRRKGLNSWKVASHERETKELLWWDSEEAYKTYLENLPPVDQSGKGRKAAKSSQPKEIPGTCWMPANAGELGLEGCLRLVPHDQNTGGFFVCVLERKGSPSEAMVAIKEAAVSDRPSASHSAIKRPLSPSAETAPIDKRTKLDTEETPVDAISVDEPAAEPSTAVEIPADVKGKKKDAYQSWKEDPFYFLPEDDAELKSCVDFFGLKPTFPVRNCMVRNKHGAALRSIYVCNNIIKTIVTHNDVARLRLLSAGIRVFLRQDSSNKLDLKCKWRIPSEGLHSISSHLDETKIIDAGLEEMRIFLENSYPMADVFSQKFQADVKAQEYGCLIVRFNPGEAAGGKMQLPMLLPVWKAKSSLALMTDKKEKSMLSLRTFGEDICKFTPSTVFPSRDATESGAVTPAVMMEQGDEVVEGGAGGVGIAESAAVDEEAETNEL